MKDSDLIQKLINEVVSQRIAFKALLGVLAARFDPENPMGENLKLIEEWERIYQDIRPAESASFAKKWGLPLSVNLQADLGLGAEFEAWFRRQAGDDSL
jgi:hypothetical protein